MAKKRTPADDQPVSDVYVGLLAISLLARHCPNLKNSPGALPRQPLPVANHKLPPATDSSGASSASNSFRQSSGYFLSLC